MDGIQCGGSRDGGHHEQSPKPTPSETMSIFIVRPLVRDKYYLSVGSKSVKSKIVPGRRLIENWKLGKREITNVDVFFVAEITDNHSCFFFMEFLFVQFVFFIERPLGVVGVVARFVGIGKGNTQERRVKQGNCQ